MKIMKRLSLLMVVILIISTIAGCQGKDTGTGDKTTPSTTSSGTSSDATQPAGSGSKLFEKPVKLTMSIVEHPTYPYNPDAFLRKKILELYNVDLEVTAIQDGYYEKLNLDMASGEMTDLIYQTDYNQVIKMGYQGALIDFNKYLDKMPNFKKWAEQHKDYLSYYYSANGELFMLPNLGYGEAGNRTFWMYRKDLFDKHNLEIPKTDEEVYQVSKTLKNLYPDSYPLCNRGFLSIFGRIGVQWNTGYPMYYNNSLNKWVYGPIEDNFKEMIAFFNKMYKEGLIPPNSLTLDTKGWQDLISTNKGFITSDYIARIDFFNVPMRQENPEFTLAFMPPFKGGPNGIAQHSTNDTLLILGLSVSSTSKNIDACIKYLDNMYTEEAINLYTWGVEGESYEVVNGKKKYKDIADGAGYVDVIVKYGFFQRGFFLVIDPEGMISTYSPETMNALYEAKKYDHPYRVPFVPFTSAAEEQKNILETNINTFMEENISKFILGERPLSEWDAYVKELEALGVNDLIKLYNDSYNEFKSKLN